MATFNFRFQSVLEHRRRIEDECQRELAQHLRTHMILEGQLQRMERQVRQSKHELADALVGRVDVQRVSDFARYSGHSAERARQLADRISQAKRQIDQARAKLLDATRQRKAMELLRSRHEQAWRKELRRREAMQMDELATQQFVRGAAGQAPAAAGGEGTRL